ncbi:hypothetical protein PHYPSEUDO_012366 [Phytophthora pseudosyringae]|uniref:Uncharacterized protein n=1 Tax=Phytophthora pseudosyringae TaxID=221518 RepID=A0A8T1V7L4_9STRA|nr:hypothetical protein PHYPSEUDO_012366 [Phytophthora pseudosyringae]
MSKRTHGEIDVAKGQASPPVKAAKSSVCEYCSNAFTSRGMGRHQKKCAKKQAHDKAAAKKTRSYKFCILNEAIHEETLSFLGNQTLTKMQMITSDRYQQCEPVLARYCCKCENDNPVIGLRCCRMCISSRTGYGNGRASKREAKHRFGVEQWAFSVLACEAHGQYDRRILEEHMVRMCGSKREWVRYLAKKDIRKKKARATRIQNRKVGAFLYSLAPGFAAFVKAANFKTKDMKVLEQCNERFVALKLEMHKRGLLLRADSAPCKAFTMDGIGSVADIVDTIAGTQI